MAKTLLITGANTGLGYATVHALLSSSTVYTIFLSARTLSKAAAAVSTLQAEVSDSKSTLTPLELDVSSDDSIAAATAAVEGQISHLDVLINNAGASFDGAAADGKMTPRAAFGASFDVNVAGAHLLTTALAPLLVASRDARLLFITSGASSLGETVGEGMYNAAPEAGWPKPKTARGSWIAYRASKVALNMVMREWERTLRNDGVKVFSVAPGLLATGLAGDVEALRARGALDASVGGERVVKVVEGGRDADRGLVVREYGEEKVQAF